MTRKVDLAGRPGVSLASSYMAECEIQSRAAVDLRSRFASSLASFRDAAGTATLSAELEGMMAGVASRVRNKEGPSANGFSLHVWTRIHEDRAEPMVRVAVTHPQAAASAVQGASWSSGSRARSVRGGKFSGSGDDASRVDTTWRGESSRSALCWPLLWSEVADSPGGPGKSGERPESLIAAANLLRPMGLVVDPTCPAARGVRGGEIWVNVGKSISAALVVSRGGGKRGRDGTALDNHPEASMGVARVRVMSQRESLPRGDRGWYVSSHAVFRRATQVANEIVARSSVVGPFGPADHSGIAVLAWLASLSELYAAPCASCSEVFRPGPESAIPPLLREPPTGAPLHVSCWVDLEGGDQGRI